MAEESEDIIVYCVRVNNAYISTNNKNSHVDVLATFLFLLQHHLQVYLRKWERNIDTQKNIEGNGKP